LVFLAISGVINSYSLLKEILFSESQLYINNSPLEELQIGHPFPDK